MEQWKGVLGLEIGDFTNNENWCWITLSSCMFICKINKYILLYEPGPDEWGEWTKERVLEGLES